MYNVATSELLSGPRRTGKASTQIERSPLLDNLHWNAERITTTWFIILGKATTNNETIFV